MLPPILGQEQAARIDARANRLPLLPVRIPRGQAVGPGASTRLRPSPDAPPTLAGEGRPALGAAWLAGIQLLVTVGDSLLMNALKLRLLRGVVKWLAALVPLDLPRISDVHLRID